MWKALKFIGRILWRWDVVGIGATLMFGFGVSAMYADDYRIAIALYLLSIGWLAAKALAWEETVAHHQRAGVSILIFLLILGSLVWVRHRQQAHTAEKQEQTPKTVIIAPSEQHEGSDQVGGKADHPTASSPPTGPAKKKKALVRPQTGAGGVLSASEVPTSPPISLNNSPGSAVSVNQQGGTTAGTINYGPVQRRLTAAQRTALVTCLKTAPAGSAIFLMFSQYNFEAQTFSDDFQSALVDGGWTGKPYPVPYTERRTGNGIQLQVADHNKPPHLADVLRSCLFAAQLKFYTTESELLSADEVMLYIGVQEPGQ
jgi:hypothetical protein